MSKEEVILLCGTLIFCYLLLFMIDYIFIGPVGIIYQPNLRENWSRLEFNYEISINSFGIRDTELEISKEYNFVLGDSFVFGEGVNIENTISKKLSKYCNKSFINLGESGGNLLDYLENYEIAKGSIKHGNITIVVVYMGNDIMDYNTNNQKIRMERLFDSIFLKNLRKRLHIITQKFGKFKNDTCDILPKNPLELKKEEYNNYLKIDKDVYRLATQNKPCHQLDINPYLVREAIRKPNYFQDYFNSSNINKTENLIKNLNDNFSKNNGKVIFILIPEQVQLNSHSLLYTKLNMNLSGIQKTKLVNKEFVDFCQLNNLNCLDLLPEFENTNITLYWKYDPHLTPGGYDLVAKTIAKAIC